MPVFRLDFRARAARLSEDQSASRAKAGPAPARGWRRQFPLGIGVTVARLTLDQLVKVRILDPQLAISPGKTGAYVCARPKSVHWQGLTGLCGGYESPRMRQASPDSRTPGLGQLFWGYGQIAGAMRGRAAFPPT